jgi:segregation and condensation protein B
MEDAERGTGHDGGVERVRELEAIIFAARGPVTPSVIRRALPDLTAPRIAELVGRINRSLREEGRPYEIAEIAGGYQFRTLPELSEVIRSARPEKAARLSRAALETLAVIAYRQPLTRAEIEDVRSVDCGAVLRGLLERDLVRIAGRRDAPGRPPLYATSSRFLEAFGLRSLSDLPPVAEIRERALAPSGVAVGPAREPESSVGSESGEGAPPPLGPES